MKKRVVLIALAIIITGIGGWLYIRNQRPPLETKFIQNTREVEHDKIEETKEASDNSENKAQLNTPKNSKILKNSNHVYQTFNNCGPATLSMTLSWYGIDVSQEELGEKMRPYQNPRGDNDDKTIFTYEFVDWAEEYGINALERPNGDIELLKKFIANDIPVVTKTWLHPNEDIGHFRLVIGFDEEKEIVINDDSYEGPNQKTKYYDFLSMWQPFNYNYLILYTNEMENKVMAILESEKDKKTAWKNSLKRAEKEKALDPTNPYPIFNIATAAYHLGDYEKSIKEFEEVEQKLPRRMLWYQIEPILSYKELGDYDRVFEISNKILNNGNRAFSELYLLKGEIFLEQGKTEAAKEQFELALKYNKNLEKAKEALDKINSEQ